MALFNMLGYAAELVFLLSASYILQDNFHLSPQELWFGSIGYCSLCDGRKLYCFETLCSF